MFFKVWPQKCGLLAIHSFLIACLVWGCGMQETTFEDNMTSAKKDKSLEVVIAAKKEEPLAQEEADALERLKEEIFAPGGIIPLEGDSLGGGISAEEGDAQDFDQLVVLSENLSTNPDEDQDDNLMTRGLLPSDDRDGLGDISANPDNEPGTESDDSSSADEGGNTPDGTGTSEPGVEQPIELRDFAVDLVQKEARKVDILWVIDSSRSMAEEQAYLGENFNSFISALATSNSSFQTAITTSDICHEELPEDLSQRACPVYYGGDATTHLRGSFVGNDGEKVLSYDNPNLIALFNANTQVGVNGSNFEHGLKATELAITKALNGENPSFLRDDAFLSVIIVSDEEDDGVGLNQTDAFNGYNFFELGLTTFFYDENYLINYLNQTKGAGNFSISTIAGTRTSGGNLCTSPHSQPEEEGTTFINAAHKTGGIVQSICDTNWASSLFNIGQDLNAQITQVHLDYRAIPASIKVFVEGVETSAWSFIEGSNSVKFNSDAVPAPGSQIHIDYTGVVEEAQL